jgi:hypothetical protein
VYGRDATECLLTNESKVNMPFRLNAKTDRNGVIARGHTAFGNDAGLVHTISLSLLYTPNCPDVWLTIRSKPPRKSIDRGVQIVRDM